MEFFAATPYIARIILSLFCILVFQRLLGRLDAAMALGAAVIGLWTGHSPLGVAETAWARLVSAD
ncbi:MAG: hypothetical protein LBE84_12245, partial [Planctomycetota bacterium]|nr:hypothetical protein [Planctomycetota bacterium]